MSQSFHLLSKIPIHVEMLKMATELLKASNFLCFLDNYRPKLVALPSDCWEYTLKSLGNFG